MEYFIYRYVKFAFKEEYAYKGKIEIEQFFLLE
jgi:hypothetical protein